MHLMHTTYDDEVKTPGYSCPTNAVVCMCTLSVFTVFSVLFFVATVTLITYSYFILFIIDVL